MIDHIEKALSALEKSKFRSRFELTEKDHQYIQGKGIDTIRSHAVDFITGRIAPAFPKNDGKQTPMRGHPVFIAQHATATCCRRCISKWHGIGKGRALNPEEIDFIVVLIMEWVKGQLDKKVFFN
jgi:hypothetical protein